MSSSSSDGSDPNSYLRVCCETTLGEMSGRLENNWMEMSDAKQAWVSKAIQILHNSVMNPVEPPPQQTAGPAPPQ